MFIFDLSEHRYSKVYINVQCLYVCLSNFSYRSGNAVVLLSKLGQRQWPRVHSQMCRPSVFKMCCYQWPIMCQLWKMGFSGSSFDLDFYMCMVLRIAIYFFLLFKTLLKLRLFSLWWKIVFHATGLALRYKKWGN